MNSATVNVQAVTKDKDNLISVNGVVIEESVLAKEVQYHPAASIEQATQSAAQALVLRELLRQDARAKDLDLTHEEQAFHTLVEANSHYQKVSNDDCERYYQQNLAKFTNAPLIEVSHILLAVAPDDIEGRIKHKQQAEQLIAKLLESPELFSEYVQDYSGCPSNKTAGSLGQISKGQTVVEFERQVFPLSEGLCDHPIESRYGYHIVFINKKIEGSQLEYPMVADKIENYLNHRRYRQAVSDYLYRLVEMADIQGIELQLEQENIVFA
jgi:peptidyl-prolyl cis-trans isomerase C